MSFIIGLLIWPFLRWQKREYVKKLSWFDICLGTTMAAMSISALIDGNFSESLILFMFYALFGLSARNYLHGKCDIQLF